MLTVSTV